jgi:hypothetical protein
LLDQLGFVTVPQLGCLLLAAVLALHLRQFPEDLLFIRLNPLLDGLMHLKGLRQAEQMVLSPMPAQLFGDLLHALPAARVPQLG